VIKLVLVYSSLMPFLICVLCLVTAASLLHSVIYSAVLCDSLFRGCDCV